MWSAYGEHEQTGLYMRIPLETYFQAYYIEYCKQSGPFGSRLHVVETIGAKPASNIRYIP